MVKARRGRVCKKSVMDMTLDDFRRLPFSGKWSDKVRCRTVVFIPGSGSKSKLHDSGYRCMGIACVGADRKVIQLIGGGSDAIHIGGLGVSTRVCKWTIDCLPKSGLLQLFSHGHDILAGPSLSSFDIVPIGKDSI